MNTVLQHCWKNVSFQYHSAILISSKMHIMQALLDGSSKFFFSFSPPKHFQVWLLILPRSSPVISRGVPTINLSIQQRSAMLLQSACIFLSFLLPWAPLTSRVHFCTLFCLLESSLSTDFVLEVKQFCQLPE